MKKFKIEYLIYLFIIVSPFLDSLAFLYREWLPDVSFSPFTFIRPLIPVILLGYIFITDKKARKYLVFSALIFIIYGALHLLITKKLLTGISYGTVMQEAQYILNYTYMVYLLFIMYYFVSKKRLPYLKKALKVMLAIYLLLIYVAIFTGTSYSTYLEGMGYRGWNVSGNSIGTILVLLVSVLVTDTYKNHKIDNYLLLFLSFIYLVFLLGTRTGMLGFFLIIIVYFIINVIMNRKVNLKKMALFSSIVIIFGGIIFFFKGSEMLKRRDLLKKENTSIIDVNTGEYGYTTGDTAIIVNQINNEVKDGYMSDEQKKSYLSMYEFANKHEIKASNRRMQQLIYHLYLIKYQHNILYILFGNGYLTNYGEMTLEMEMLAILFNFGLIGFVIYIGPFIFLLICIIKKCLNKRKINLNILMNIFFVIVAFALSFLAGYVFFSASCVLVVISMIMLAYREVME